MPRRTVRRGANGNVALDKKNHIIIDTHAPQINPQRLGLFDVSITPPVEFRPTEEDIAGDWVREGVDDIPEPVVPEAVDEALAEIETPSLVDEALAEIEPPALLGPFTPRVGLLLPHGQRYPRRSTR